MEPTDHKRTMWPSSAPPAVMPELLLRRRPSLLAAIRRYSRIRPPPHPSSASPTTSPAPANTNPGSSSPSLPSPPDPSPGRTRRPLRRKPPGSPPSPGWSTTSPTPPRAWFRVTSTNDWYGLFCESHLFFYKSNVCVVETLAIQCCFCNWEG